MQLDIDLMRDIMLRIEATRTLAEEPDLKFDDYESDHVDFNLRLLINNGFVEGGAVEVSGGGYAIHARHLTWDGFEFLSNIRHETVLESVKRGINEKGFEIGTMALRIVADLAMAEMRRVVGLSNNMT